MSPKTPHDCSETMRAEINAFGEYLRFHNLSVLVFPNIPTGNVFWVTRQPSELPLGKGKTLVEALEKAGVLEHVM